MRPLSDADPTRIASYRLLGVLGGGGMGRVYLGRSPAGRRVAIKVIRPELAEDPVFRRRFAREVATVRSVSPLCTATVVDADTEAAQPWLATTYIDGPSLDEWVDRHGPLAAGAAMTLAAGLAEALESIHLHGLIHRDLKPSNVLLDDEGPRIIDFGIAVTPGATQLTTSFVGTPSYTSPERLRGGEATTAGDIFALGATLVYACTGRKLAGDGALYEQVVRITTGRFDLSGVPRELRSTIARCLQRAPKDRPTAAQLTQAFAASGAADPAPRWYQSVQAPLASPVVPVRLPLSRRRVLAAAGASVMSVAVAGGAFGLLRTRSSTRPGAILSRTNSGAPPPPPGTDPTGERVVYAAGLLITTGSTRVFASDRSGRQVWSRSTPGGPAALWRWGDGVLVAESTMVRLLDAASGEQLFARNLEAGTAVHGVTSAAGRAFLDLGSKLVALDRAGELLWQAQPAAPRVADADWLVTQNVSGEAGRAGLYAADSGAVKWTADYSVPASNPGPPPGGNQPPPGGGPPPDGGPPPGYGPPPDGPPPGPDPAWSRSEGRITSGYVVLRDVQQLRVLRVSDRQVMWKQSSPAPIAAIELAGSTLVVSADQMTGRAVPTGDPLWTVSVRGAQLATRIDRPGVVAANAKAVSSFDDSGRTLWSTPLPDDLRGAMPDWVGVEGRTAVVTFRARPGQTLRHDVLWLALA